MKGIFVKRSKENLTQEMKEVILLAAQGETSTSSALILGYGCETVRYRLRCAIECLGAKNIINAVAIAVALRLIDFHHSEETNT